MYKIIILVFIVIIGGVLFWQYSDFFKDKVVDEQETILVGALLDITGDWSSLGESSKIALNIAVTDINDYFSSIDSKKRIEIIIKDTKGNPEKALEELKLLKEKGVMTVIGPQSSSEVKAVKNYADQNNILIISQGSTAHSLAYPNDNVFRFVTDDVYEGKAVADLMNKDGIKAIIPIWRDDAGNGGLHAAVTSSFEDRGGIALDGQKYDPDTKDFKEIIEKLNLIAEEVISEQGADSVAIYLATFNEVINIFNEASKYDNLSKVKWYGSNGVALSSALIDNSEAVKFAVKIEYPCPINAEGDTDDYNQIKERVSQELNKSPETYSMAAYDALWVIAESYSNVDDANDFEVFKSEFIKQANSYTGITGSTALNEAGDRMFWKYDFWAIKEVDGSFKWQIISE